MNAYTANCIAAADALKKRLIQTHVSHKSIRGRSLKLARQGVEVPKDKDGAYRAYGRYDLKTLNHRTGEFS